MENRSRKKRMGELITPYFNQTKNPRLWLLFQYFLGGTFDKRKLVTKDFSGQKKILEIGCSSGLISSAFTQFKNIEFLGIDIDEKAIAYAKNRFSGVKNFDFRCCSLEELRSESKKFDYILFASVLHHISDNETKKMLQTASTLLSNEGIIVITEPLPANREHSWLVKLYHNLFEQGLWVRSKSDYETIISNISNLQIIKSEVEPVTPFKFKWPTCLFFVYFLLKK